MPENRISSTVTPGRHARAAGPSEGAGAAVGSVVAGVAARGAETRASTTAMAIVAAQGGALLLS